jgi:hypothetical protein
MHKQECLIVGNATPRLNRGVNRGALSLVPSFGQAKEGTKKNNAYKTLHGSHYIETKCHICTRRNNNIFFS